MVVTRSRLHAVRYKQAIDEYIKEARATTKDPCRSRRWWRSPETVNDPDAPSTYTEAG
jgi:hypothetical protein